MDRVLVRSTAYITLVVQVMALHGWTCDLYEGSPDFPLSSKRAQGAPQHNARIKSSGICGA